MAIISIVRTRNGIPVSAEGATLQVTDSAGAVVVATTPIVPTSAGHYSYAADTLVAGIYTAIWTFSNQGYADDVVTRVFSLDPPVAATEGIQLADLERYVARRVGPYIALTARTGSTIQRLSSARIQSSLSLGSYEDQFMLRRGVTSGQQVIPGFVADDRYRMVALYDSTNGWLIPDRDWTNAPSGTLGEQVEIHALDPENELRPAILDGLKRCFFWDTVQVSLSDYNASGFRANLTALVPWLSDTTSIREASYQYNTPLMLPQRLRGWQPFRQGKDIWLSAQGAMTGTLVLDILRPASSFVNEEMSLTGPNDDFDMLYVNLDYAAWASIVELWKTVPERLAPLTRESLRPDLKAAAAEFTKHSLAVSQQMPMRPTSVTYGSSGLGGVVIGNLPETVA